MIQFNKILFATDFSDDSDYAFDYALYFAKLHVGKLYILHVLTKDYSPVSLIPAIEAGPVPEIEIQIPSRVEEYEAEIKQKMFEIVQRSRKQGLIVEDLFTSGKPFAEIIRVSQERKVDLIIMGSHKKSELELRFLGSTVERVSRKVSCPVLIIRRPSADSGIAVC